MAAKTCGYGILVAAYSTQTIAHELRHVAQMEELGFRAFLQKFYDDQGPLEADAEEAAKRMLEGQNKEARHEL